MEVAADASFDIEVRLREPAVGAEAKVGLAGQTLSQTFAEDETKITFEHIALQEGELKLMGSVLFPDGTSPGLFHVVLIKK